MKLWTLDQLARLPQEQAVQKHFDRLNYRVIRWAWRLSVPIAVGFFVAHSVDGDLLRFAGSIGWLALLAAMFFFRRHAACEAHFPKIVPAFLLASTLAMMVGSPDGEFRRIVPLSLAPLVALYFRMPLRHHLGVAAGFVAMGVAAGLLAPKGEVELGEAIALPLFLNAIFVAFAIFLSRQARRAFLEEWTGLALREKERERMSDELADARKIQLAMLPASTPAVEWLSIASASTPASEVGGDFYDHFLLDDGTVAIAIGDVAGHGVGSGLVLAGIKSGLHLLREELSSPVVVLERLNRLASEWLQWRMLVTLLIVVVDPRSRSVRAASAGHAPLLIVGTDGTTRRVGAGALPLGTKLGPVWREETAPLAQGDVLVLYTDGLTELLGASGLQYGDERLEEAVREAMVGGGNIDSIRDALLASHQAFRGGAPQLDDISVVFARFDG